MIQNPHLRRRRMPLPDQSALLALLSYDMTTGNLSWRVRPLSFFVDGGQSAAQSHAAWNAKMAGRPALQQIRQGYLGGTLFGTKVMAHRVIWKMITGQEADNIDHINGVRSDNRWSNLREVTTMGNAKNAAIRSNNTSGVVGVTWTPRFGGKWVAQIVADGQAKFLGQFDDFDEAVRVRKAAERQYGFHPNHGRAAS